MYLYQITRKQKTTSYSCLLIPWKEKIVEKLKSTSDLDIKATKRRLLSSLPKLAPTSNTPFKKFADKRSKITVVALIYTLLYTLRELTFLVTVVSCQHRLTLSSLIPFNSLLTLTLIDF